ncbi:hypothetical protein IZU99_05720 [Oscillospiraceae bacterium CM]|nr:hypothetical protein IZU99_05720 [Oscillospiraceae bacterium CM]
METKTMKHAFDSICTTSSVDPSLRDVNRKILETGFMVVSAANDLPVPAENVPTDGDNQLTSSAVFRSLINAGSCANATSSFHEGYLTLLHQGIYLRGCLG